MDKLTVTDYADLLCRRLNMRQLADQSPFTIVDNFAKNFNITNKVTRKWDTWKTKFSRKTRLLVYVDGWAFDYRKSFLQRWYIYSSWGIHT